MAEGARKFARSRTKEQRQHKSERWTRKGARGKKIIYSERVSAQRYKMRLPAQTHTRMHICPLTGIYCWHPTANKGGQQACLSGRGSGLISIHLRSVNHAVAQLQSPLDRITGLCTRTAHINSHSSKHMHTNGPFACLLTMSVCSFPCM